MKFNLKIPPVAIGASSIFLVWLLYQYLPIYHIDFIYKDLLAFTITATGIVVALSGVAVFIKSRTTVDPMCPEKARELVIIGIYKYSRNPMYLGILMVIIGSAVYFAALSSFFIVPLFMAYMNRYQILPEEAALQEKFGEQFTRYANNVRRWL
jgi:protein-S-isoprenylcysteine O-methyltransferase Ste14